jgi:hypothetical protein
MVSVTSSTGVSVVASVETTSAVIGSLPSRRAQGSIR